jgi:hypothetical protein
MIDFLTLQIRLGRVTIDQIPEQYRDAVRAEFAKEGL